MACTIDLIYPHRIVTSVWIQLITTQTRQVTSFPPDYLMTVLPRRTCCLCLIMTTSTPRCAIVSFTKTISDWPRQRDTQCTKRRRTWMADFNSGPDPCQYIPLLCILLNHKARQRLIDDSTPPGNQWRRSNNFTLHYRMSTLSACYSYHHCPDIPHGLARGEGRLSKVHGTIYKAPTRDQNRLDYEPGCPSCAQITCSLQSLTSNSLGRGDAKYTTRQAPCPHPANLQLYKCS